MGRLRFPGSEVERKALSDGDWIEIKRVLNVGERRGMWLMVASGDGGELRTADPVTRSFARVAAYLVDWSFRDAQDKPVPVTLDAIKALDVETMNEIEAVLEAHEEALDREKKATPGADKSEPT